MTPLGGFSTECWKVPDGIWSSVAPARVHMVGSSAAVSAGLFKAATFCCVAGIDASRDLKISRQGKTRKTDRCLDGAQGSLRAAPRVMMRPMGAYT